MVAATLVLAVTALTVLGVTAVGVLAVRGRVRTVEDYIAARGTAEGATLTATVVGVVRLVAAVFGSVAPTLSAARRSADQPTPSAGE
jgi:hypothetical protein